MFFEDNRTEPPSSPQQTVPSPAASGKKQNIPKEVQYSNICYVILIPTRQEFKEAGLDLWYQPHEHVYNMFDEDKENCWIE